MSSSRVPLRLRLTAAQNGLDPLTHYWFKVGKNEYRRICDSVAWLPRLRYRFPPGKECGVCRGLHHTDRMVGKQAFSLTNQLRGVLAPHQEDRLYAPPDPLVLNKAMNQVSIATFSNFCTASANERARMVNALHSPGKGFAPYYGPLRAVLRRLHWEGGNIDCLTGVEFNISSSDERNKRWKVSLHEVLRNYIAYWQTQRGEVFKVPPLSVSINTPAGDLSVKVDPEVGMKSQAGEQGLKLWFGPEPMTGPYSVIFHYLLGQARNDPNWPAQWHLNVLDVRRQVILLHPPMPDDIEDGVTGYALDWLRIIEAGSG